MNRQRILKKQGDEKKPGPEALKLFDDVINAANAAKREAELKKRQRQDEEATKKRSALEGKVGDFTGQLRRLQSDDVKDVRELVEIAQLLAREGDVENAELTLKRAEDRLDLLRERKEQAASATISEARQLGADGVEACAELFEEAVALKDAGDAEGLALAEAVQNYEKAAELARDVAERVSSEKRRVEEQGVDESIDTIKSQMAELSQAGDVLSMQSMLDEVQAHVDGNRVDDARQSLRRADGLIDLLLKEEREAEEDARRISESEREEVKLAKEELDRVNLPEEVDSKKMMETLFSIVGNIKEEDAKFLEPFKKRLSGLALDKEDLEGIFDEVMDAQDFSYLKKSLDLAAVSDKLTRKIPDNLKELLYDPDRLKDLMLGDKGVLDRMFRELGKDVGLNDFHTFVDKARKNLVDGKLGGIINKVLPSGFGFDKYTKIESPTKTRFLAKIRYLRKIHVNKNNMLRRC